MAGKVGSMALQEIELMKAVMEMSRSERIDQATRELTEILHGDPRNEIYLVPEGECFSFVCFDEDGPAGVDVFALHEADGIWAFGICTQVGSSRADGGEAGYVEGMKGVGDIFDGKLMLFVDKIPLWLALAREAVTKRAAGR
ncbi:MAG: hypothetical protein KC731_25045 [Myxococcales bacterium]|nr:hypothetical protein [Myxococcales bacterium]